MRFRVSCQWLAAGLFLVVVGGVAAQTRPPAQRSYRGTPVASTREPGDAAIPGPGDLTPETQPRAFVESFLVALVQEEQDLVYDAYLDASFRQQVQREAFTRVMGELTSVLGPLENLSVRYLRQDNANGPLPDRGYADYVLAFERDPNVDMHVEFERVADRHWKVTDYSLASAQLLRFQQARAAAEEAEGEGEEAEETGGEGERRGDGPGTPPSP